MIKGLEKPIIRVESYILYHFINAEEDYCYVSN